jgi:ABC-2 type transport system ATP-binding protein
MSSAAVSVPLVVSGLGRRYGATEVVHDISFSVARGEIVGLLGPNGAGKSTTLRMLAGCLAPSSGTATVRGCDVVRDPRGAREAVGYAPETPPLDPTLTVHDLIAYASRLRGVRRVGRDAAVAETLRRTDLTGVASRRIEQLSRGVQRRVGIAQALVHSPTVLLLDEPTAGLDPDRRAWMRTLLRGRADGGVAILLSTHLLGDAEELCDRVLILRGGTIAGRTTLKPGGEDIRHLLIRVADPPEGAHARLAALAGVIAAEARGPGAWKLTTTGDLRSRVASAVVDWGLLELRAGTGLAEFYRACAAEPERDHTR